ncbi:MAG: rhodanese-like domain-containing protein [Desulfobacterales bacterium]|nr:rhodanese-like domain-containing protein [Desulfobacterales bacterium]
MFNRKLTLFALCAVAITVGTLWLTNRAAAPKESTWDNILAEAKSGGYQIITTEKLAKLYRSDSKDFFLVDTRQEWEYRIGHIQGALNFPIEPTWWSRYRKASALETFIGPDKNRFIVFY